MTATATTTPAAGLDRPLELTDRCDRCGSAAYVRATFSEGELLFCGHDYRKHQDRITATALYVHDETGRLEVKRDSGFNV